MVGKEKRGVFYLSKGLEIQYNVQVSERDRKNHLIL